MGPDPEGMFDLIADSELVYGIDYNVLVIFQEDQKYDLNLMMRSSAFLIVVNIPKTQYDEYCFCDYE